MFILSWSNDFITGEELIDAQHFNMFEMINAFAIESDLDTDNDEIVGFIDRLAEYASTHFDDEERLMRDCDYPLAQHHTNIHAELKDELAEMRNRLLSGAVDQPMLTVLDFVRDWLNLHMAKEDLSFFTFYRDRESLDDESLAGWGCEVMAMDGALLGAGVVAGADGRTLVVDGYVGAMVEPNDIVKLVVNAESGAQVIIARVLDVGVDADGGTGGGTLRLFHAKRVNSTVERKYVRVPTEVKATFISNGRAIYINVADISVGGLLVETDVELAKGDEIQVEFSILNDQFMLRCAVMSVSVCESGGYRYGCEFLAIEPWQLELISEYVFARQCDEKPVMTNAVK